MVLCITDILVKTAQLCDSTLRSCGALKFVHYFEHSAQYLR